jgi:hypothetical protein
MWVMARVTDKTWLLHPGGYRSTTEQEGQGKGGFDIGGNRPEAGELMSIFLRMSLSAETELL